MASDPVEKLSVSYNSTIAVISAIFILIISALVVLDFQKNRDDALFIIGDRLAERARSLDNFLEIASNNVRSMQQWAANTYQAPDLHTEAPILRTYLSPDAAGEVVTLDQLPERYHSLAGNLFGTISLDSLRPQERAELEMALRMFEVQRMAHHSSPPVTWTFYLSRHGFMTCYPWVNSQTFLEQMGAADIPSLLENMGHVMPVAKDDAALPKNGWWTEPHLHPQGEGLVVSFLAPVWQEPGQPLGFVGMELDLARLRNFIVNFDDSNGELRIVDRNGRMIMGPNYYPEMAVTPRHVSEMLRPEVLQEPLVIPSLAKPSQDTSGKYYRFTYPLPKTGWHLVYVVSKADVLRGFLPTFSINVGLILGLFVFLFVANYLVRRSFIKPALALVEHIRTEASSGTGEIPQVSDAWTPWFRMISDTLPLKAVAANLPGAVFQFVMYPDERLEFSFMTDRIKDVLGMEAGEITSPDFDPLSLAYEEDRPALRAAIELSRDTMGPFEYECAMPTVQGDQVWVQMTSRPRKSDHGRVIWDGLLLDVTEREHAEEAQRQSERKYRLLVEQSLQGLVVLQKETPRIVFANSTIAEALGYSVEALCELDPSDVLELIAPQDREAFLQRYWDRLAGKEFQGHIEFRMIRSDGTVRWMEMFSSKITLDGIDAVQAVLVDITERRQAEQALRAERDYSARIIDRSPVIICGLAPDGTTMFINPAGERITGYSAADLVGRNWWKTLYPGEDSEQVRQLHGGDRQSTREEHEMILTTRLGEKRSILWNSVQHVDGQGRLINIIGFGYDNTARMEAEQERARLAAIVQQSDAGIISHTIDGTIMTWNTGAERVYGYTAAEAIGQSVTMLMSPNRTESILPDMVEKLRRGEKLERYEVEHISKAGETIYVMVTASPVRDSRGQLVGISAIIRDYTKRREAEQALARRDEILHAVSDAAETFLQTPDWQAELHAILRDIGQATEVDRVYVFENHPSSRGQARTSLRYEWAAAEASGSLLDDPQYQDLEFRDNWLAGWPDVLGAGESICGPVLNLSRPERAHYDSRGVQSLALVPIFVEGRWWGVMGFDEEAFPRQWSNAEVDALRTAASVLGAAIQRKRNEDELERARQKEINIGSRIQQTLLLGKVPDDIPQAKLAALTIPSHQIDGDFTEFIKHDNQHLDVIIGDVMGKGVPAALLGAAIKSVFLQAISSLVCASNVASLPTTEEIVMYAHQKLCGQLIGLNSFSTVCYTRFNLDKLRMDVVDCGHTNALHLHGSTGEVTRLKSDNMPIGFTEWEVYKQMSIRIAPGDMVFFYSDGLIEAKNNQDEVYGMDRLIAFLRERKEREPAEILKDIYGELVYFSNSVSFADDLTCIAVRIESAPESPLVTQAKRKLSSDLSDLVALREFIRELCGRVPALNRRLCNQVELAVNEAVANIMRHSYHGRKNETILIQGTIYEDSIVFELFHWGEPMSQLQITAPAFDGSQDHGFGLYLIRNCVDEIAYSTDEEGKSCVRLIKRI
jgi:phosphoserine phosphatase RsbU/P